MTQWDALFWQSSEAQTSRESVEEAMVVYMERAHQEDGCPWYAIARHMLGLYHGQRGARLWRQVWSDHRLKPLPPREVWKTAWRAFVDLEVDTIAN
jgi:tRNA-dihydrouridine synthase A